MTASIMCKSSAKMLKITFLKLLKYNFSRGSMTSDPITLNPVDTLKLSLTTIKQSRRCQLFQHKKNRREDFCVPASLVVFLTPGGVPGMFGTYA